MLKECLMDTIAMRALLIKILSGQRWVRTFSTLSAMSIEVGKEKSFSVYFMWKLFSQKLDLEKRRAWSQIWISTKNIY